MKMKSLAILGLAAGVLLSGAIVTAQRQRQPPASPPATVTQQLGIQQSITINYHRPGVKGRNVWKDKSDNAQIGPLVPWNGDPRPWRAGANNATTIEFSADVKVEGQDLSAGTYALFMIPTDGDWTIIFSKNPQQWGSFRYNQEEDALRVDVTPIEDSHQEWLMYGFDDLQPYGATAYLRWEKKRIPFKIELTDQGAE